MLFQMHTLPPVVIWWTVHQINKSSCRAATDPYIKQHIEMLCWCVSECSSSTEPSDGQHAPQRHHARWSHASRLLPGMTFPLCHYPHLPSLPNPLHFLYHICTSLYSIHQSLTLQSLNFSFCLLLKCTWNFIVVWKALPELNVNTNCQIYTVINRPVLLININLLTHVSIGISVIVFCRCCSTWFLFIGSLFTLRLMIIG